MKEWDDTSENYYEEILSPIKNSVENPLLEDLRKVANRKSKKIIEVGCGLGELTKFLSERFEFVTSTDISTKMIEKAKIKNSNFENAEFFVKDTVELNWKNKFDVAVSVNSIISPEIGKDEKMFKSVFESLKKSGKFFCILPAMEVYIYQAMLLGRTKSRKEVGEIINSKEHDFLFGKTKFDYEQKNYYRFEILWKLKSAGFSNIEIGRVNYSWDEFEKAGQMNFPNEKMLPWDWYIRCRKN